MKKHYFIFAIFSSIALSAQIYTPNGNIGGATTTPAFNNIGIGTDNPQKKLDVNGHMRIYNQGGPYSEFTIGEDSNDAIIADNTSSKYYGGGYFFRVHSPNVTPHHYSDAMVISDNGYVGIGSLHPDSPLTVKGLIHAEEIKVDLNVPADYVFEKYYTGKSILNPQYTMPSLEDVEKFTKQNNHLPNIPSANELKEKGLKVGEMTNLLLQKIEELTLYSIEQNKRIKELESKINKN